MSGLLDPARAAAEVIAPAAQDGAARRDLRQIVHGSTVAVVTSDHGLLSLRGLTQRAMQTAVLPG